MEDLADWKDLVGLQVQVRKDGRAVRVGQVEAVTLSSDALWIAARGVESRVLYEKACGYSVLPFSGGAS